ncbi:hypothetical protein THAOC_36043, partial [Thalassiosira oceanica]
MAGMARREVTPSGDLWRKWIREDMKKTEKEEERKMEECNINRTFVQIEKETNWSIELETINNHARLIACPFAFTEIGYFDLHWPDNTKPAKACEYGKVLAGPHHVIAAQGRRHRKKTGDSPNDRSLLAVLNAVSHELVERQLGSQHQQVAEKLDPALVGVLPKVRPLPLRGTLEKPPRSLLDQRQAVDGIGPLPSERLARLRNLAEIPRIEQGGQEKHDIGVEERGLDG